MTNSVSPGGLMEDMTWPEISQAASAGLPALLSVGSTEQHGPHLPLATDCYIPQAIALAVARRLPLVIAPPVHFGARSRALSGGGETFPGTLSLRATTLISTIHEVLSALARSGFTRLCLFNWHYENAGVLWEACDLTVHDYPDIRILLLESSLPPFSPDELASLFPKGFPGWDVEHASIMETSLMYVIRPDLVRRHKIVDDQAQRHPTWDMVPAPADYIPRSGVLWHPSEATPELGQRFLDACAAYLERALRTEFDL